MAKLVIGITRSQPRISRNSICLPECQQIGGEILAECARVYLIMIILLLLGQLYDDDDDDDDDYDDDEH